MHEVTPGIPAATPTELVFAPEAGEDEPRLRAVIAYWDSRMRADAMYSQSLANGWTEQQSAVRARFAYSGYDQDMPFYSWTPPEDTGAWLAQVAHEWQGHFTWLRDAFGDSRFKTLDVKMAATSMGWTPPPGTWHLDSPGLTRKLGLAYAGAPGDGALSIARAGTIARATKWRIVEGPATDPL